MPDPSRSGPDGDEASSVRYYGPGGEALAGEGSLPLRMAGEGPNGYMVRVHNSGPYVNMLYNPGLCPDNRRSPPKFRKVDKIAFEYYLKYLRHGNEVDFRAAARML